MPSPRWIVMDAVGRPHPPLTTTASSASKDSSPSQWRKGSLGDQTVHLRISSWIMDRQTGGCVRAGVALPPCQLRCRRPSPPPVAREVPGPVGVPQVSSPGRGLRDECQLGSPLTCDIAIDGSAYGASGHADERSRSWSRGIRVASPSHAPANQRARQHGHRSNERRLDRHHVAEDLQAVAPTALGVAVHHLAHG